MTTPRFTPEALAFLRALKRHNDREWFKARKEQYDTLLREPMIAVIERLADDFRAFAPDLVANPKTSLYRIYRDTRFSENKAPLKTHVAAVFPCRGLGKHQGAGPVSRDRPDLGVGRRRDVRAGHVPAAGGARAHRRQRPPLPDDRGIARVPARTSGRSAASGCSACRAASRAITRRPSI